MNTKDNYIKPDIEIIEMEVTIPIMGSGDEIGVSNEDTNDWARSRKSIWGNNE